MSTFYCLLALSIEVNANTKAEHIPACQLAEKCVPIQSFFKRGSAHAGQVQVSKLK